LIHFVPRDNIVQKAEFNKRSVIEFDMNVTKPMSTKSLQIKYQQQKLCYSQKPMSMEELEDLVLKYGLMD